MVINVLFFKRYHIICALWLQAYYTAVSKKLIVLLSIHMIVKHSWLEIIHRSGSSCREWIGWGFRLNTFPWNFYGKLWMWNVCWLCFSLYANTSFSSKSYLMLLSLSEMILLCKFILGLRWGREFNGLTIYFEKSSAALFLMFSERSKIVLLWY